MWLSLCLAFRTRGNCILQLDRKCSRQYYIDEILLSLLKSTADRKSSQKASTQRKNALLGRHQGELHQSHSTDLD